MRTSRGTRLRSLSDAETLRALVGNLLMDVIAEGVETGEQLPVLRTLDCEKVQGFLFWEPMTPEAATALVAGQARR
ncbi:MAG: EAL domain-containing protein [Gemmatimonadota bacterium]